MIFRSRARVQRKRDFMLIPIYPQVFPYNTNDIMIYLSKLIRRFKWTVVAATAATAATP